MVAARRSKSLTTGNVRCGVAAVHEVLGSLALETPVNCHSELMEDSLGNIEPVQLGVEQMLVITNHVSDYVPGVCVSVSGPPKVLKETNRDCWSSILNRLDAGALPDTETTVSKQ